jgi:hypothetical protein
VSPLRRALLELLLGAWLAVSLCTIAGAVMSFGAADEMRTAGASPLAPRVQAAAFNGHMFASSMAVQLVIAGVAALVAVWPGRRSRWVAAAVIGAGVLVAVLALVVVPRANASAPEALRDRPGSEASERMRHLHRVYGAVDLVKSALLAGASVGALRGTTRRADAG